MSFVQIVFPLPVVSRDERVLTRPCEASLLTVWPLGRVDPHAFKSALPARPVPTKPTKHDGLSTHFPEQWDPVLQEPHIDAARCHPYLFVHKG